MSQQAVIIDRYRDLQARATKYINMLKAEIEQSRDQHKKDLETIDQLQAQIDKDRLIFAGIDKLHEASNVVRKK